MRDILYSAKYHNIKGEELQSLFYSNFPFCDIESLMKIAIICIASVKIMEIIKQSQCR